MDADDDADEVRNNSVDSDQEPHAEGAKNSGEVCGSDSSRPDAPTKTEVRGQRKVDDVLDQLTKSEVATMIDLAASRRASRRFSGRLRDKMSKSMISRRGESGNSEVEAVESNRPSQFSDSESLAQVNRTPRLSSAESSSGLDMSDSRTGQTLSSARRQSSTSVEKAAAETPTVEAYVVVEDDDVERQQQRQDAIVDAPVEPVFAASIVERKPWHRKTKNVLLVVGCVVVVALAGTIGALARPRSRVDAAVSNIGEGSEVNGTSYNSFSTEKDDLVATVQPSVTEAVFISEGSREYWTVGSDGSVRVDLEGATAFRVTSPGLSGGGDKSVSFEIIGRPGYYLRHSSASIISNRDDGSESFRRDATFINRRALTETEGYVSFESTNTPLAFIRRDKNARLRLSIDDGSTRFAKQASFQGISPILLTQPAGNTSAPTLEPSCHTGLLTTNNPSVPVTEIVTSSDSRPDTMAPSIIVSTTPSLSEIPSKSPHSVAPSSHPVTLSSISRYSMVGEGRCLDTNRQAFDNIGRFGLWNVNDSLSVKKNACEEFCRKVQSQPGHVGLAVNIVSERCACLFQDGMLPPRNFLNSILGADRYKYVQDNIGQGKVSFAYGFEVFCYAFVETNL